MKRGQFIKSILALPLLNIKAFASVLPKEFPYTTEGTIAYFRHLCKNSPYSFNYLLLGEKEELWKMELRMIEGKVSLVCEDVPTIDLEKDHHKGNKTQERNFLLGLRMQVSEEHDKIRAIVNK